MGLRLRTFSRGPEHCHFCGDAFIETEYSDGFRRNGSPIVRRWRHCPRHTPDFLEYMSAQYGSCTPLSPWACANEQLAWKEHRPWHGSCGHRTVNDSGSKCWDADHKQLTGKA